MCSFVTMIKILLWGKTQVEKETPKLIKYWGSNLFHWSTTIIALIFSSNYWTKQIFWCKKKIKVISKTNTKQFMHWSSKLNFAVMNRTCNIFPWNDIFDWTGWFYQPKNIPEIISLTEPESFSNLKISIYNCLKEWFLNFILKIFKNFNILA